MKHSMMIVMAAALSLAATPAMASISASYGSDVSTPPIGDSNDDFDTETTSAPSGVPSSGSIDHVTWSIGNYGLSSDSIKAKLCSKDNGQEQCSPYNTGYKGNTSVFAGWRPTTKFYLKIQIVTDTHQRFQTNYTSRQSTHIEIYY
ncbi:hypothetical protein [Sphingomonas sp. BK069]|uniref:hypothetical protein n=1 Tax=Sphingomonas sp. BK069 TaxID=2586979 RepID=UPI00161C72AC|nr:hypothetical protein [Sphingomonas sp. BK069]MBB3349205.1 hypothetical protein [Sphingomonas sp. BK069]